MALHGKEAGLYLRDVGGRVRSSRQFWSVWGYQSLLNAFGPDISPVLTCSRRLHARPARRGATQA